MKSARPRTLPQNEQSPRDRILDCAIELFSIYGFEAMTMRALGKAAGLDNSSLYRHFASKMELAHAALDRVAADFLVTVGSHFALSRSPSLESLESVAAKAGTYFFDRPAAARLMMHWVMSTGTDGPGFGITVAATNTDRPAGQLIGAMRAWLDEGVRCGAFRRYIMPDAVIILFGALLLRPATYGYLLATMEPKQSRAAARNAWENELRAIVRGAFAPCQL